MKRLLIGSAAAALVIVSTPLSAQPAPPPPPGVGQGTAPLQRPRTAHVPPVIRSPAVLPLREGAVTRDEMLRHVRALFARVDTNHDGRVSLSEAEAAALAHFDRADLDRDGKITPDERRQAHERMRAEHRRR